MFSMGLMPEYILLYFLFLIMSCVGYDRILYFNDQDCSNGYQVYDMTQYDKYLVSWSGTPFKAWCSVAFKGRNPYNVETKYKICVSFVKQYFENCIPRVEVYDGFLSVVAVSEMFDCHNSFPPKWCSETDYLNLRIISTELSNSYLDLEITVEADISLSIAGAIGIAVGGVLGIIMLCCCIKYINSNKERQSDIQSLENQENLLTDGNVDYRHRVHEPYPAIHYSRRPENSASTHNQENSARTRTQDICVRLRNQENDSQTQTTLLSSRLENEDCCSTNKNALTLSDDNQNGCSLTVHRSHCSNDSSSDSKTPHCPVPSAPPQPLMPPSYDSLFGKPDIT